LQPTFKEEGVERGTASNLLLTESVSDLATDGTGGRGRGGFAGSRNRGIDHVVKFIGKETDHG